MAAKNGELFEQGPVSPSSVPPDKAWHAAGLAGKYLTFQLGQENYGFGILSVREIIRLVDITPVPRTPDYIRGIINLRGKIIPVVDVRKKFELELRPDTDLTCIVVVDIGSIETGVIVDSVAQVVNFTEAEIEMPPSFGPEAEDDYIVAIGKSRDQVTLLINASQVMDHNEIKSAVSHQQG